MCKIVKPQKDPLEYSAGMALHEDNWRVVVKHDQSDGCEEP
jgi:hypothetical protein